MRKTRHRVFVLCLLLLIAIGCSRTAPILNYPSVSVVLRSGERLGAEDIRDAIVLAAANKGWTTKDIEPGLLEATLQVRQHVAVVTIAYSANSYGINYKDSVQLRYGGGEIHHNYNRWIRNLKRQIERQIRIVAEQRPR